MAAAVFVWLLVEPTEQTETGEAVIPLHPCPWVLHLGLHKLWWGAHNTIHHEPLA
jgi:hypothetical protein